MQRGRSAEAGRLRRMPLRGPNVHGLVDRREYGRHLRIAADRVLGRQFRGRLRRRLAVVLHGRSMRGRRRGQRLVLVPALTRRRGLKEFYISLQFFD